MNQRTLKKIYKFEGKGLHTGKISHIEVCPAAVDTGIVFYRTDLGPDACVQALASNVVSTRRSTTIGRGRVKVQTIEHLLSALTGLGVDNAIVKIDTREMPILDGSAMPYVQAICQDGVLEQDKQRVWITPDRVLEYRNKKTGSYVRIEPAEETEYICTIDFNSRVLGVQKTVWNSEVDYASQIAPCRTFCFFHEILKMAGVGLVKGGDVQNAIVVVERPVSERQFARVTRLFNQPLLKVAENGYLSNLDLHFEDECGRHKLMDLIGDMRLCGGFLKARVIAYKPGHSINTKTAKLI